MSRDYRDTHDCVRQASARARRLFACACYWTIREIAKSKKCDAAVKFAESYPDHYATPEQAVELKKHWNAADASRRATPETLEDGGKLYQRELARELATVCCAGTIPPRDVLSCAWGIRTWLSKFDEPILKDLGIIGLDNRNQTVPKHPLLRHMAEEIYTYNDFNPTVLNILADAIQDHQYPDLWAEHLRTGRHWKGCWVLDGLIGKQ